MTHQCSMKYKDLTLYAILLYHQQVSNAQSDLIEKLHSIVLLCLPYMYVFFILNKFFIPNITITGSSSVMSYAVICRYYYSSNTNSIFTNSIYTSK